MLMYIALCLSFSKNLAVTDFPINEFLKIEDKVSMPILQQYLCSDYTGMGCCSCEKYCMNKKQCCIDKLWNNTNPLQLEEYVEMFIREADKHKDTTCEDVFPLASKLRAGSKTYLMVSTCSSASTKEDVDGCKNINNELSYDYNIPVFGSDNYLYKNSFCARCNFIDKFDLVNISATCLDSTIEQPELSFSLIGDITTTSTTTPLPKLNVVTQFNNCNYDLQGGGIVSYTFIYANSCSKGSFIPRDKCLPNNKYYKLCNSYHAKMDGYANYHCYLCIHGDKDLTIKPNFGFCIIDVDKGLQAAQWSFTINFSDQTKINVNGPWSRLEETFCNDNKVYNIFTETCEAYTCSNGYKNIGHTCEKLVAQKTVQLKVANPTFDKCIMKSNTYLVVVSNTSYNIETVTTLVRKILNSTENLQFNEIVNTENMSIYSAFLNTNRALIDLLINKLSDGESKLWSIINNLYITRDNPVFTKLHNFDISRTFSQQRLCVSPIIYHNYASQNFLRNCSFILNNITLSYDNISQWISFSKDFIQRKFSSCNSFYLQSSCKLISISNNYTISNNQTLNVIDKVYSTNEYTPDKYGLSICAVTKVTNGMVYNWKETVSDAQSYISYIGTSISIVCYIIISATYLFFKELRTVPGYTIVGLCITLLFTDILFLVATQINDNFVACKTIGILLHWGLLATHTWVVIMAFDLLSRFGSVAIAVVKSSKKRFIKYCVFVVGAPTFIVGTALVLNEQQVYISGYGSDNICFIRNLYPRIYFYIIPTAASFIIALGAFTKSIVTIKVQEDKTRKVLLNSGREDNNVLVIGLKLVLTLGLIEMIGFIQIAKHNLSEDEEIINAFFATFYTICRSLRGVILFIIYMCTKQKLKLFKSLNKENEEMLSFTKSRDQTKVSYISTSH